MSGQVRNKLREAVSDALGASPGELHPDLHLGELDGWDSMNAVNFTMEVERHFGVDLEGAIFTADQTIRDVVSLLRDKGVHD